MKQLLLAQAQDGDGGAGPGAGPGGGLLGGPLAPLFLLGLFVLFFLFVMLPASRRQKKEQERLISSLKRGMKVLTSGGIVGAIVTAKDGEDEIVIRSEDSRMRIKRSVVVQVLGSDESEASKA